MTEEDIYSEVRSVFAKPMRNDPLFPFRFLQATGRGNKTLTIPAVSTHFRWTASKVARLGCFIYIICDWELAMDVSLVPSYVDHMSCHNK